MRRLAVLAAGVFVTACTSGSLASSPATQTGAATEPVRMPLQTRPNLGGLATALHGGTLSLEIRQGVICSLLGDDAHVVWPDGYTSDATSIRDQEGQEVARAGDTISIGGGFGDPGDGQDSCGPPDQAWIGGEVVRRAG